MTEKRSRPGAANTEATSQAKKAQGKRKRLTTSQHAELDHAGVSERGKQPNEPLNWALFLSAPPPPPQWLLYPLVERGQHALLFSETKAGKSLLTLDLLVRACNGQQIDGSETTPLRVLYLDYENSDEDIHLRLHAMEATAEGLDGLAYVQFPELSPLDTARGGRELHDLAVKHKVDLVVIDTISRALEGPENDSSTANNFYRYSLLPLRQSKIASLRLDHAGKDERHGARGSSAKNSDVDAVWQLKYDKRVSKRTLSRTYTRRGRGPDLVKLDVRSDPLLHLLSVASRDAPHDVEELCKVLDKLGVPPDRGRPAIQKILKNKGYKVGTARLEEVVKRRKASQKDVPR